MPRLLPDGYEIIEGAFTEQQVDELTAAAGAVTAESSPHGVRNLFARMPQLHELTKNPPLRDIVQKILGAAARPVRGILFDKTPDANWKVAWHQDLSIVVEKKLDAHGFGPWSVKEGVVHVQPPRGILEKMLTVRIHLDDCDETNGPLRVLPGSHQHGVLSPTDVEMWQGSIDPVNCCVSRGGVLLMRPLLLHASSSAQLPRHRRVIHLEFASADLPGGLAWRVA